MSSYIPLAIYSGAKVLIRGVVLRENLPLSSETVRLFLISYQHSKDTYNTYRREVERYCQWVWFVQKSDLSQIDRHIFLHYIDFFNKPPKNWIADRHYPRTILVDGAIIANPKWRPFVGHAKRSQASIKSMLACVSTFYTFLMQEQLVTQNPVQMLSQKKQLIQSVKSTRVKRRLSQLQWNYLVDMATQMANVNSKYERNLYIISLFFLLGLRISEIAKVNSQEKPMNLFYQDKDLRWWFEAHGKGNKKRDVAVPDAMLEALSQYRKSIGLMSLPAINDQTPLVPKIKGEGGLAARQIRQLVSEVFDQAYMSLIKDGYVDQAQSLKQATVHWLRHTAISEDVLHRPAEDVRDDVGHENISTTSLYIDVMDAKRHASAKYKKMKIKDYD
jgi:site-specific recombinase XerD